MIRAGSGGGSGPRILSGRLGRSAAVAVAVLAASIIAAGAAATRRSTGRRDLALGRRSDLRRRALGERTPVAAGLVPAVLAAAGHVVMMRADAKTFTHEHAEVEDNRYAKAFFVAILVFMLVACFIIPGRS